MANDSHDAINVGQVYISIECIHSAEITVNNETF